MATLLAAISTRLCVLQPGVFAYFSVGGGGVLHMPGGHGTAGHALGHVFAHASDRNAAVAKLASVLQEMVVHGEVACNSKQIAHVLDLPEFLAGSQSPNLWIEGPNALGTGAQLPTRVGYAI
jgi:biotin carboxylase